MATKKNILLLLREQQPIPNLLILLNSVFLRIPDLLILLNSVFFFRFLYQPIEKENFTIEIPSPPPELQGVFNTTDIARIAGLGPLLGYAAWEYLQQQRKDGHADLFPYGVQYHSVSRELVFRTTKLQESKPDLSMVLYANPADFGERIQYTAGCPYNRTTLYQGIRRFFEFHAMKMDSRRVRLTEGQLGSLAHALSCADSESGDCQADYTQAAFPDTCFVAVRTRRKETLKPKRLEVSDPLLEDIKAQIYRAGEKDAAIMRKAYIPSSIDNNNKDQNGSLDMKWKMHDGKWMKIIKMQQVCYQKTLIRWIKIFGAVATLVTCGWTKYSATANGISFGKLSWRKKENLSQGGNHVTALDVMCSPYSIVASELLPPNDYWWSETATIMLLGYTFKMEDGWMLALRDGIVLIDNQALYAVGEELNLPRRFEGSRVLPYSLVSFGVPLSKSATVAAICNEFNLCLTCYLTDSGNVAPDIVEIKSELCEALYGKCCCRDGAFIGQCLRKNDNLNKNCFYCTSEVEPGVPHLVAQRVALHWQLCLVMLMWGAIWLVKLFWRHSLFLMPLLNECILEFGWQYWTPWPFWGAEQQALHQALDQRGRTRPLLFADMVSAFLEVTGQPVGEVYCTLAAFRALVELARQAALQPFAVHGRLSVDFWGRFPWGGCVKGVPGTRCGVDTGSRQLWFYARAVGNCEPGIFTWHVKADDTTSNSSTESPNGPFVVCGSLKYNE